MRRYFVILALLAPLALHAAGAPATGCATRAPDTQGYPRNFPCCTHPDYDPEADGTTCLAPVSVFRVAIKEFGFLRNDGTKFYYGSEQTFDLASASAGTDVGNFISGVDLPAGTYIRLIPVASREVQAEVNVRIAGGRRCSLNSTFPLYDPGDPPPACTGDLPTLAAPECMDGTFIRSIDDHPFSIAYDPARGMTVEFGFYLDNGARCDFSGSGDVTATFYDMPVVINVREN